MLRLECEKLETAVGGEHFQNVQIFLRNMPIMCNPGLVFAEACTFRTLRRGSVPAHRLFVAGENTASPGNRSYI